jgi:dTDP-4-amino-4,6-dideoxygalactose transaminase
VHARVQRLRAFGQSGPGVFSELGTNAKMSELHAALGLAMLDHLDSVLEVRRRVASAYDAALGPDRPALRRPRWHPGATRNYVYYPLLLADESRVLVVLAALEERGVNARRYFHPSLNKLPFVEGAACPVAEDAARRAICLPLHAEVSDADARAIARTVLEVI